jgi:hypothetical protein
MVAILEIGALCQLHHTRALPVEMLMTKSGPTQSPLSWRVG